MLSQQPFSPGLQGSIKAHQAPAAASQVLSAVAMNSGPLSDRMWPGHAAEDERLGEHVGRGEPDRRTCAGEPVETLEHADLLPSWARLSTKSQDQTWADPGRRRFLKSSIRLERLPQAGPFLRGQTSFACSPALSASGGQICRGRACLPPRGALSRALAGSAPLVRGPFPVADKHIRGSWLCQGPGPGIWRPPESQALGKRMPPRLPRFPPLLPLFPAQAKGQGPRAKGQGPRAKGQGPRAKGQGPRAKGQGPRAKGDPRLRDRRQGALDLSFVPLT